MVANVVKKKKRRTNNRLGYDMAMSTKSRQNGKCKI